MQEHAGYRLREYPDRKDTQLLSNLASVSRAASPALVSHYNVQPVYDIFCDVDLRDLGGVAARHSKDSG